jgi:hypothetical protein
MNTEHSKMPEPLHQMSDEMDDVQTHEGELPRMPSSPSNSWSSGETVPLSEDSPIGERGDPRRAKRCKISRDQLAVLISSFEEEPLPNFEQRQALAKALGMTPRSVQIWFQNRRQRLKPAQPKASGMGGYGSGGARGARGGLSAASVQSAQQLGMPGLAAAAGLCSGSTGGLESLLSHAMSAHLAANSGNSTTTSTSTSSTSGNGYGGLQSYDVMEPFAATKALFGAGYNPANSVVTSFTQSPRSGPASVGSAMPGSLASLAPARHTPSPASLPPCAAPAEKAPVADGLLLLLACADNAPAGGTAEAPSAPQAIAA